MCMILNGKFVKLTARENIKKKIVAVAQENGYIELKEEQECVMIDLLKEGMFSAVYQLHGFGKRVSFTLLPDIFDSESWKKKHGTRNFTTFKSNE